MQRERDFSHRVPELDGIRGVAILAVVIFHWVALQGESVLPDRFENLLSFGWSGVDLFFVLSGFLIGGILLDSRDSSDYFKVFYMRRVHRILPLYGAICLSTLLLFYWHLSTHAWFFWGVAIPWYSYLTFGQNFWIVKLHTLGNWQLGVTWSLAVEEQFYLTLPFVIRFASRRALPYLLGVGILLAPVIRVALWFALDPATAALAAEYLTPCRMDALLLGVLAAWAVRDEVYWQWLASHKAVLGMASILLGAGFLELIHKRSGPHSFGMASFGYTLIALFYLSVLLLAITQSGFVSRLFRFRGLTELGILAYGLYLFHMPVIGLVYGLAGKPTPQLRGPATFALTFVGGLLLFGLVRLSWLYFEKPMIKRGHRYEYHHTQQHPGAGHA
jgi:peptidoglycan/LPS O-acetylase OafA/YrhL